MIEQVFDYRGMLDLATKTVLEGPAARMMPGTGRRDAPPLPVSPALVSLLPGGLRRGSTVSVTGSVSLLLALLGAASAEGAWCALVGMPSVSAESASEYGIELSRLAVIPHPGKGWSTAVGALLDAVDVIATRPPGHVVPGDVRRLAARARTRDTVLVPFLTGEAAWPGADLRLRVQFFFSSRRRHTNWTGDWSSDVCSSDLAQGLVIRSIKPIDALSCLGEGQLA